MGRLYKGNDYWNFSLNVKKLKDLNYFLFDKMAAKCLYLPGQGGSVYVLIVNKNQSDSDNDEFSTANNKRQNKER